MNPIRVLVANQPRLMRELIVQVILEQPDIEIVAEITDENDIPEAVHSTRPDFLIVALGEADQCPPFCSTLLKDHPETKILALAPERNYSVFFWASMDIHSSAVEASEDGILSALRSTGKVVGG